MNPDGTGQTILPNTGHNPRGPAWSPDGSKIAYHSTQDGGWYQIYVINADGTGKQRLTYDMNNEEYPSWGPAGSLEVKSSPSHAQIYINGVDTGKFAKWTFADLAPGDYEVSVALDGYNPQTEMITIVSEQTVKLHFKLDKIKKVK